MSVLRTVHVNCWISLYLTIGVALLSCLSSPAHGFNRTSNISLPVDNETILFWTQMNMIKSTILQEIQEKRRSNRAHIIFWSKITALAYIAGAIFWIVFNVVHYTRQKRQMEQRCKIEEENAYKALENERLLKIYQEIPGLRLAAMNSFNNVTNPGHQLDSRMDDTNTDFQLNRAKVEATLRFKPPPKFLSRI